MISLTREDISRACSSNKFAKLLASKSPFVDETSLLKISREIWWNQMSIFDWLEAFQGHPTIGDRNPGISKMSSREQATAAETATEQTSADLLQWNAKYKERFGHIFLICARGRTSDEILQELQTRYHNNASIELHNAASEQQKITENRLLDMVAERKHLGDVSGRHSRVDRRAGKLAQQVSDKKQPTSEGHGHSPITTHILDTSNGRPASGVAVDLEYTPCLSSVESLGEIQWTVLGRGRTNRGGRLSTLLPDGTEPKPGIYCLVFHIGEYYEECCQAFRGMLPPVPFYPLAKVYFTIRPDQIYDHFHVPLTWNPFGYSTYRGS